MTKETTSFVYVTYILATPEKLWRALIEPEFTRQYWVETLTCFRFFGQSECLFWTRAEGASDGNTKSLGRKEADGSAASSVHGGVQV